ncbi:sugar transporter [Stenotrophomonas sp. ESTM1D_MKCIP4_1]|uniref:LPS translocon maturation chaperone LptM n=1 Tax=Stenotrophomonas sp. ESTM1D_MKCIP4_1 TaxID=2072414 RepID=UPI000D53EFAE|nr:lipoprotein [Stenotrophomonas sp. ESTM1D_MKCIP4_1]AWH54788.1 sugar transporter [Stenotrophomonas sp. ESTM1D_MKCIP4_1]
MKIPHRNAILIPLAAASLLFLSACGNKGPLVLPQKPVPVEETVEPAVAPEASPEATPAATQPTSDGSPSVTPDPIKPVDDGNE